MECIVPSIVKQNKTKQNKTKQNKTKQNKTKHGNMLLQIHNNNDKENTFFSDFSMNIFPPQMQSSKAS